MAISNKLSSTTTKTEFLIIGSHYNLANLGYSPEIMLGDTFIKRVYAAKSLDVWDNSSKGLDTTLQKLQNRAGRVILRALLKRRLRGTRLKPPECLKFLLVKPHPI